MMKYEAPDQTLDLTQINETQDTSVLQSFNVSNRSRHGSAISYPRDVMSLVCKRVKRSGHQASKYCFNISFKELIINAERKPEKVQIAVMHRRRRYACKSQPLENSFSSENKFMITWPDLAADIINFNTTLFKDPSNEEFDSKEWTIIVEEITKKGKIRPLAAVQLNFAFFVNQTPHHKTELKLKLRCLQKYVKNCTLSMILSSTFVKEGHTVDDDHQSQASVSSVKVTSDIPFLTDDNEKITEGDFEDWKDENLKPTPPQTPSLNNDVYTNPQNAATGMEPSSLTFDSVKRYGSMTSAEMAETLSQIIAPVMPADSSRDHQTDDNTMNATLTRKIVTSFEKNVIHVEDINEELQKITERIKDVENLGQHILAKMQLAEQNSEDEQKYLIEHMKLLNEKDALVRKQDYFNVAGEMNEIEERLELVQQQVNEVTTMNDTYQTKEEKQRIDDLVAEYKLLIDKKNELAEILIQKEAEEEENEKFRRDTLERSQNFFRGSQEQPLNTSQRIINWIKSTTS